MEMIPTRDCSSPRPHIAHSCYIQVFLKLWVKSGPQEIWPWFAKFERDVDSDNESDASHEHHHG